MRQGKSFVRAAAGRDVVRHAVEGLETRRLFSTVSGAVYNDTNYDGLINAGDTPLAGVNVEIYVGDTYDTRTLFRTLTTDADGKYAANDLPDGKDATVTTVPTPGYVWADVQSASWTTGSPYLLAQDFLRTNKSMHRGYVFTDSNRNGTRESNEYGSVAGTRGYLDLNNNSVYDANEPSGLSDSTGIFYIGGINPGTYAVRIVPAAGYTQAAPAGSATARFTSTPTNTTTDDFGIKLILQPSVITGYSFEDADANGVIDLASEKRNAGRTIYVDLNASGKLDAGDTSTVTDANGYYELSVQNTQTVNFYSVYEVLPTGYTATGPVSGKRSVAVSAGNTTTGQNFGSLAKAYVVSGTVFDDLDGDGVHDVGSDTPRVDRMVFIDTDNDGRYSYPERYTLSDINGGYSLIFGAPGSYTLGQSVPTGRKKSRPQYSSATTQTISFTSTTVAATADFGSRAVSNTVAIDSSLGAWSGPSTVGGIGSSRITFLADGGWLAVNVNFTKLAYTGISIRRYKSNGGLDTTFGTNGTLNLNAGEATEVLELPDGKIVVAGTASGGQYGMLRRLLANGAPDLTFGTNGVVTNFTGLSQATFIGSIAVAANGDLLVASVSQISSTNTALQPTLTRLSSSGVRQTAFGYNGSYQSYSDAGPAIFDASVVPTADGGMLFTTNYNRVLKLTAAGTLDTAFASAGVLTPAYGGLSLSTGGVRILADGRILTTGTASSRGYLARYTADGKPDLTFGDNAYALLPAKPAGSGVVFIDSFATALPLPNGGYLAVGQSQGVTNVPDLALARFTADGTLDTGFYPGGIGRYSLSPDGDRGAAAALMPDGRVNIAAVTLNGQGSAVIRLADTGTLTGRVYVDANANNTFDAGDVPQGGTVRIDTNLNGTADASDRVTTVDASTGLYRFDDVATGGYKLFFQQSSAASEISKSFNLSAKQSMTVDFPITSYGSISGIAFNDANQNGVYDSGSEQVTGGTVFLDANDNGVIDTGERSEAVSPVGSYNFAYLLAGTYRPRLVLPSGTAATTTPVVTLAAGQNVGQADLGQYAAPITDPASVTLEAELATLTGGTHVENANAGFTGTGYADFDVSGSAVGFTVTRAKAGQVSLAFRYANGGTADRPLAIKLNGVAVGTLSFPPTGSWATWKTVTMNATLAAGTNTIVATAGAASGANVDNLTIAAAVTPPSLGTLSGFCFDDTDKDSVLDANEKKTSGKTVFLDADNDGVLDSNEKKTTTASDGSWNFTGLVAGEYHVRRVFPSGYTQSTPLINIALPPGEHVANLPIGSKSGSTPPAGNTASIAGTVFADNNKNGKYDSGDGYGKGVVVFLDGDNDGKLDAGEVSVTTDGSGKFSFTKLAAGTYRVRRVMPSGYTYSTTKPDVTLTNGQAKTGVLIGTKKA